ncbi:uncharacterized protein F4822DRAFT_441090 [Hypoxylon trugodes]|uniref:uncharacterized protein n=1 Tax=Hypoxylon trugodes TaxID=326681 RepID=UPI00219D8721|nr:uncharacterized protein F4822DRAFT_441090 [Hypoxylon trugodes]KAI1391837.1 hypothetical protein F4822DRAFT_441090 [Hypoxylon trugodes]
MLTSEKRQQLCDLAVANWTFGEDGDHSRRVYTTFDNPVAPGIICHAYNSAGHIAHDCPNRHTGAVDEANRRKVIQDSLDRTYAEFVVGIRCNAMRKLLDIASDILR